MVGDSDTGGRATPSAEPRVHRTDRAAAVASSLRERFGALRNLPPFLKLVWQTSPGLTAANLGARLVRALLPVATLYVGKLIIDEVVRLAARRARARSRSAQWLASGRVDCARLALLGLELGLAVLSDVLGRVVSLLDSLLSERFSNATSVRLMEHAATLDLEDFEDSELQDRLERARRQTTGRTTLMSQLFGQAQDVVTIASFAAGLDGLRAVADRAAGAGARARVPRRGALQRAELLAQLRQRRRSGASSTTCARPAPASRPRRK